MQCQWSKEKGQKDKHWSTQKSKDQSTGTLLIKWHAMKTLIYSYNNNVENTRAFSIRLYNIVNIYIYLWFQVTITSPFWIFTIIDLK